MKLDGKIEIITGTSNPKLIQEIEIILKKKIHPCVTTFADGEIRVQIPVNARNKEVYIVQSTSPSVNDHLMELLLMIDAAKRASAKEITAIIPYYGYGRQDRKDSPRVPVSSALVAELIETAGAHRVITVDIHSDQQQGFFRGPWDNLYGSYALLPVIKALKLKNLIIASPDKGGVSRANAYAKRLKEAEGIAIVYKERDTKTKNQSEALDMIGEVKGKNVILIDDMLDTGGTIVNAANLIKSRGAAKIYVVATHGLFSGNAIEKLNNSPVEQVIVTNTLPLKEHLLNEKKIKVVSVAKLLAESIIRTVEGTSLSADLIN